MKVSPLPEPRRSPPGDVAGLRARIDELERHNEELHRFSAAVAHELKEPLIAIASYATLLTERLAGALDAESAQDLEALVRGATRMRVIVDTLLQRARSALPPERVRVELAELAEECAATLEPEISGRGARVVVRSLPAVTGDPLLLCSVLQNLLTNALRYGAREGGVIALAAARAEGGWRITVDGDGVPIGAGDRARIFDPFQRGRGERRAAGIGLGLAICREIVEQHGGTIGVEPLEHGNRFFFTLPD
jgi:signal transduction histidine kinase